MAAKTLFVSALLLAGLFQAPAQANVAVKVELDRTVLPAATPNRAIVRVSLTADAIAVAGKRAPVNLAIVLDRSGSMSGNKIARARDAALEVLQRMNAQDRIALVVYDSQAQTLVPAQSAVLSPAISQAIQSIQPGSNTALFAGVSQGAAEVRKNLDGRFFHRIILLSDGLANEGPSNPEDLERLGRALLKEQISVTTVGLGNDYNEDLMTRLSQASDGNAYFVENAADLSRIFQKELGDVLSVAATEVLIRITCPPGIHPLRIVGREGSLRDNGFEIRLNQLYGAQEKYVLAEVEVPATNEGLNLLIAQATVTWQDLNARRQSAEQAVSATFSRKKQEILGNVNRAVQIDYALNSSSLAFDQSVQQMDAGNSKEAASILNQQAQQLRLQGTENDNDALTQQAAKLENQAKLLEEKGLDDRQRKIYRTNSYNTRQQQAEPAPDYDQMYIERK